MQKSQTAKYVLEKHIYSSGDKFIRVGVQQLQVYERVTYIYLDSGKTQEKRRTTNKTITERNDGGSDKWFCSFGL